MENITKEYSNGAVTVIWQPKKCIHSAKCWRGLPRAFNPNERPWITLDNVSAEEIIEQVFKCPSGALSIREGAGTTAIPSATATDVSEAEDTEISVLKNGPLMVKGSISIRHKDGTVETKKDAYLCRCGQSENKPFCDGAHKKCGFKDE